MTASEKIHTQDNPASFSKKAYKPDRHLVTYPGYAGQDHGLIRPNPAIDFATDEACLDNGMIAP